MGRAENHHLHSLGRYFHDGHDGGIYAFHRSCDCMGRHQDDCLHRMGGRQDRHLHRMDGHFHHGDHGGIYAFHQPVHGMGGDEERRQHRMGEHFGGCQVCVGRHLRLLRRHLGCHYRQDGFLDLAGQYQHGQCMDHCRSGCAEFLERDVLDDFQLLDEHPVHGDLRHCGPSVCNGIRMDLCTDRGADRMGWR